MANPWLKYIAIPALLLAATVSGCGSDEGGGNVEPTPVTTVTVTAPQPNIEVGAKVQLTATARDSRNLVVEGKSFEWGSSNDAVASVSSSGEVTGVAVGSAEITATTEGVPGSIVITVTDQPEPPPPPPVSLGLDPVVSGLDFPTGLASPPPNDSRLFVTEKAGAIRVIKDGAVLPAPFLDLTGQVASQAGEQGLLGLVFPADYATSGRFLVHYTDAAGDSRISWFRVSADPDRADPASESVVLQVSRPGSAHNGGQLLFGPDGYLYIGLGDGDDSDGGRGQSLADLLGSILRIDVSGATGYTVPSDNPFLTTAGARPEVWSYGLRNPWRFTFDRATGDLYIGDVGESQWEEVNYSSVAQGAGRGTNYGWAVMEGPNCTRGSGCDQTGLTPPTVSYQHPDGCSVVGGFVYRGTAIPGLQGTYFYSDFCGGWVRSFRMEGGVRVGDTEWASLDTGEFVTSFGEDAVGELYLLTEEGGVYKIVQR
ncbi:MAG TPA: PQQ-dependent sugar dehydrogenase [Gemmatimonadales bacterium]|nr:PQQ-dependent sugar dehydrogenase [Gemmatimonadales bacterium]